MNSPIEKEKYVDIQECLGDSPFFRNALGEIEATVSDLESKLKALVKLSKAANEFAKSCSAKSGQFAQELSDFTSLDVLNKEDTISIGLIKFGEILKELNGFQQILIQQTESVLIRPLEDFMKKEIGALSEYRKKFQKTSDDSDSAIAKYAAKKPRDTNWQEEAVEVAKIKKGFHHSSLDYAMKINEIQGKKKFEVVERILEYITAQRTFFHQGYEVLNDISPFMKELAGQLSDAREHYQARFTREEVVKQEIIQRSIGYYNPMHTIPPENSNGVSKEGYLFKKASQKMKNSWDRRYFAVQGDLLVYYTRGKAEEAIVATNLRLCTVKPFDNPERRYCFSVISPIRSYLLQAENEEDYNSWLTVLQNAIANALNSNQSTSENDLGMKKEKKEKLSRNSGGNSGYASGSFPGNANRKKTTVEEEADIEYQTVVNEIKALPGNHECADCRANDPEWASINHGILCCIECSGIHRSLGVHVSKVRSLTLDKLEPELLQSMKALGNEQANAVLLGSILSRGKDILAGLEVPNPKSERSVKEKWIAAKYVERRFVDDQGSQPVLVNEEFCRACDKGSISELLSLILRGAEINKKFEQEGDKTALHKVVINKNAVATDFLLQWSCDVDAVDSLGYAPLHYAASMDLIRIVLLLFRRTATWNIAGKDGKTPLDLAVEETNEDVIMIFKMVEVNGGGREALEKTSKLLEAKNTRASLRLSTHKVRPSLEFDSMLSTSPGTPFPNSP